MRNIGPILALLALAALAPIVSRAMDLRKSDPWAFTLQEAIDAKATYDQSLFSARTKYDAALVKAVQAFEAATAETSNEDDLQGARDARAEAIAAARTAYQEQKLAARERLVVDLTSALQAAKEANDLDEALRIRSARDWAEGGWPIPIKAEAAWSYESRCHEAIENVLAAAASANAQRSELLAQSQSALAETLEAIIADATRAGDLDDAKRLRDAKARLQTLAAEGAHGLAKADGRMELPLIVCDARTLMKMLRFNVFNATHLHAMAELKGRHNVLMTHPKDVDTPCRLVGRFSLPPNRRIRLVFSVVNNESNDWRLVVKVNERVLKDTIIGPDGTGNDWADFELDLTEYAGTQISLQFIHIANNWYGEYGYWDNVKLIYE